ncbi:MAG: nucleotide sugar dehydrogenase [Anaerolineaceae bacterium]|nr:nucleotide sugar dehydrogenase [Anaerolineaceae bacterium]
MIVNVIGMGYIGLPTALMMASHGVNVVGTDYNKKLVKQLTENGKVFEEKGLSELFAAAVQSGIRFSSEYQKADIYIVSVPTPYLKKSRKIDPKYVIAACKSVLEICEDGAILVVESTISPGTIDHCVRPLIGDRQIRLAHAPERIIPGNMLHELVHNPRTIGADDRETAEIVRNLYASFCEAEIVLTDIRTAEMSKVVENTYRDINIAFANELTKICHEASMDVYEVIRIANRHPRVNILSPGPGVGGHCISVDPWFLVGDFPNLTQLIHSARNVNDSMPEYVYKRIREIMAEKAISSFSRVGLYGLTYKENVDDTRESPTLQLLDVLKHKEVDSAPVVYDPYIKDDMVPSQMYDLTEFLAKTDLVVLMVGHDEIKNNPECLSGKAVLDTRNVISLEGVYKL